MSGLNFAQRSLKAVAPVRNRLAAWLDYRASRWPHTTNPYLLINTRTAVRAGQVSHQWINQTLGLPAQAVREDRILDEALATEGGVRRLCDLFGLSVHGGTRYTTAVEHPYLIGLHLAGLGTGLTSWIIDPARRAYS